MRVVEPHQFNTIKKKKRRSVRPFIFVVVFLLLSGSGVYWYAAAQTRSVQPQPKSSVAPASTHATPAKTKFKTFTGEEFKQLYQEVRKSYPNTQPITDPPAISGDTAADAYIRAAAEKRGYQLSRIPKASIVKIDEPRLNGDDLLQPLAAESWKNLKAAAHNDGFELGVISAYRPPDFQRDLFMARLIANGTTASQIASGLGEGAIERTLSITAVPGYSRHHTGYTVDLWCEDGSGTFLSSSCYRWLSADNYLKAKEFGWIPSYPEGTADQGPEPEPWEYVWVGTAALME
jgi:D-alanyl-D-alanine carboxypeptidase